MAFTPTLDAFRPAPLRWDVRPVARLHEGGYLEMVGPEFPPLGPLLLVLWRPGEESAFEVARVVLVRGARRGSLRIQDPEKVNPAWVVLWVDGSTGAPEEGS